MQIQIPTFEFGEKVIYHCQPIEYQCPNCGYIAGTLEPPQDFIVTVLAANNTMVCPICGKASKGIEGWYVTDHATKVGYFTSVPYTLLERIKE